MGDRKGSRGVVAAGVVAAVAVGGLVLPRLVGDRASGNRPAGAAQPVVALRPDETVADGSQPPASVDAAVVEVASPASATFGVPVGYPRSPAGVRAAAVTWVSSLEELLQMGPIARDETLKVLL